MTNVNRADLEEFLFQEALLIDNWQLPDWLKLFTDDAHYYVPSTDVAEDAAAENNLFYIADDRFRLGERVTRLMKRTAHAEYPRSKLRHLISNVLIRKAEGDLIEVGSVFVTYRSKDGQTDVYFGSNIHKLVKTGDGLRIREKRCILASDGLRPQGRVSFIL
ncbi:aromatic-ring-hydroxylating dioxygenase subunit beta [Zavarzinia aquatilis]|uniref:Aromatic-ring-hydroxylating dioxygenase subunit beta n=1 Tax=Zavarzinia aquatilis TaxID=2211142 RepID=A0A317EEB9_9PROT|nr:aromatic-ring-hydroxylating dioxygenase subunit beta [Zavarzinia aquatilis]PWR25398.1 aromatic-ring-hydroxylating dioxygenase subunit beta [Zavarzinia aquatilis]